MLRPGYSAENLRYRPPLPVCTTRRDAPIHGQFTTHETRQTNYRIINFNRREAGGGIGTMHALFPLSFALFPVHRLRVFRICVQWRLWDRPPLSEDRVRCVNPFLLTL